VISAVAILILVLIVGFELPTTAGFAQSVTLTATTCNPGCPINPPQSFSVGKSTSDAISGTYSIGSGGGGQMFLTIENDGGHSGGDALGPETVTGFGFFSVSGTGPFLFILGNAGDDAPAFSVSFNGTVTSALL
jgi:hypothetical protein